LGERLPDELQPLRETEAQPVAELLLKLKHLHFQEVEGKRRAQATATLISRTSHQPPASRRRSLCGRSASCTVNVYTILVIRCFNPLLYTILVVCFGNHRKLAMNQEIENQINDYLSDET